MPALFEVLEEASARNATAVVFEVGELPRIQTANGTVAIGTVWGERELFDALDETLEPEQQAELAVGNLVEFHLDIRGRNWALVTEPTRDGIVVRGRVTAGEPAVSDGPPLSLPPLAPFEPESADEAPLAPGPVFRRRTGAMRVISSVPPVRSDEPAWLERHNEALEDPAEHALDLVKDAQVDFALRTTDTPGLSEVVQADPSRDVGFRDVMEAPGSGQLESVAAFVGSLGPGSVCFVRGEQASQQLAANLCEEGNPVVIQDADDVNRLGPPKSVAGVFVVLLEDPSTALGWLLRRVEEGARVIVNTTARTPQGSKRVLLGINSGVRAEAWLNSHRVFWIGPHDEGGWRCVPIRRY